MVNKKLILGIIIIGIFMFSLSGISAEWTAGLNTDLISYYKLDETTGTTANDALNVNDMTNYNSVAIDETGLIETSYDFSGATNRYLEKASPSDMTGTSLSGSLWVNLANRDNYDTILMVSDDVPQEEYKLIFGTTNTLSLSLYGLGGEKALTYDFSSDFGSWTHIAYNVGSDGDLELWINGVSVDNDTSTADSFDGVDQYVIGNYDEQARTRAVNGKIDEVALWGRKLTGAEVGQLYNGGSGITYSAGDNNPEVTLNSPANDSTFAYPSISFSADVTDDIKVQNVSLLIDGVIDQTNTSNYNGTYIFTKSLTTGTHNWSILAFDNNSQSTESETRTLNITIVPPTIELSYPPNGYGTTIASQTFYAYVYDNYKVENVSIYFNGSLYNTNSSGLNATNYSFSRTLSEGLWTWYVEAYDNDSYSSTSETRTIEIDQSGPSISIEAPSTQYSLLDEGDLLDLNFTISDPNLDTCITEYGGVNTTRACSSGVKFSTTFSYTFGDNNITFYANDTVGNWNSEIRSWTIQLSEIDRIFNENVVQTAQETFIYSGGTGTGVSVVSGKLWYNGTSYTPVTTKSGSLFNITNVLEIPSGVSGTVEFFWEIVYQNVTGTFSFNTTSSNQTIFELNLYECFAPNPDGLTLDFTTYDSTNLTAINSTLEATFQFYAEGGTGDIIIEYLFSDLNENRSNYMYCLNSSGQNVTLDAFISYDGTNYDRREYIIDDGIIGNFTQEIPLYLTLTEITDIVTVTVQDQNYEPISNALVAIQRWNIGTNTYSTIGMLTTSSSGQGIMDLELYTTWYRAVVYIDGVLTHVEDVQKLSSTSWIITVEAGEDNPYDLFGDISHGLTFDNSTNITSFTWFDTSGYTARGCLVIRNQTSLGEVTIFDSCVSTVSGTIDYQIVGDGQYTAYGVIFLEGYDTSQIVDTLSIRLGTPEIIETVSPFGKVISMILVATGGLIGVAAGSALFGIVLVIGILIAAMKIGFLNITMGFIWGIISIGILVVILQRRKK